MDNVDMSMPGARRPARTAMPTTTAAAGAQNPYVRRLLSVSAQLRGARRADCACTQQHSRPQLAVRAAREDEYVRTAQIVNEAFSGEPYRNEGLGPRTAPDGSGLREYLVKGKGESELLIAVDDEAAVIYGTLLLNQWYAAEDFPSAGRADTDTFGQLGVAKEARRLGVGRLLVAAAEERVTTRGKTRMELCFVNLDEQSLRPFYGSLGYHEGERAYVGEAAEWLAPEWRPGFYFQQMVKILK